MNDLIPISELADKMGMLSTNLRRYAIRHGFQFVRARMQTGNGGCQEVIALPKPEAERLIKFRQDQGFPLKGEPDGVRLIKI
jgi:hypothetical protein